MIATNLNIDELVTSDFEHRSPVALIGPPVCLRLYQAEVTKGALIRDNSPSVEMTRSKTASAGELHKKFVTLL